MRSVVVSTMFAKRRSNLCARAMMRPFKHHIHFLLLGGFLSSFSIQMNLSNGGWPAIRTNAQNSPSDGRSNQILIPAFVLTDVQRGTTANVGVYLSVKLLRRHGYN